VDLRRLRHGEWIAGISGVVLVIALFLDWYSSGDVSANAWDVFTVTDVLVAVAAAWGIALAVTAATQRSAAVPQAISALTVPFALLAAVLVVINTVSLPGGADGREFGLWLGLAASLGVLIGAWRSMGDQSFPRAVAPDVEVTPLPAPKPRSEPAGDDG
jgi:hypothetical protein